MIQVLDKGFVMLVDSYGSDLTVVNAAKVSFGKEVAEVSDKEEKLINYLAVHKHMSPFRHCGLTMRIKMPIFIMRQFVRHRIGVEINEISGRYAELPEEWYTPPFFREQAVQNKQGSGGKLGSDGDQVRLCQAYETANKQAFAVYHSLLEQGVAREQARMVLPVSTYTEIFVTMSLEAMAHFCHLRKDAHAQWEIQVYANTIEALAVSHFPKSFAALMQNHK